MFNRNKNGTFRSMKLHQKIFDLLAALFILWFLWVIASYYLKPTPAHSLIRPTMAAETTSTQMYVPVPTQADSDAIIEMWAKSNGDFKWMDEGKIIGEVMEASITMYSRKDSCHFKSGNKCLTAGGKDTKEGFTITCPRRMKLGTKVRVYGHTYTCDDRTAEWVQKKFGNTFDIFTEDYQGALNHGRKNAIVQIIY